MQNLQITDEIQQFNSKIESDSDLVPKKLDPEIAAELEKLQGGIDMLRTLKNMNREHSRGLLKAKQKRRDKAKKASKQRKGKR